MKTQQSENNIIYNNTKVLNKLHSIDLHKTRPAGESSSTTSQPLAEAPKINVIGVSLAQPTKKHPNRQRLGISVLKDTGENCKYSVNLAPYERKRELTANIPSEHRDWWGYDAALTFINNLEDTDSAYIGKFKNTTTYQHGVPKNMPIVAKTACVLWVDKDCIHTMLWIGDQEYKVHLYADGLNSKQKQFFSANGYWRNETTEIVEEF